MEDYESRLTKGPRYQSKLSGKMEERFYPGIESKIEFPELTSIVKDIGESTLGSKWAGGGKKKHSPWWNEDLKKCVCEKSQKFRKWLRQKFRYKIRVRRSQKQGKY